MLKTLTIKNIALIDLSEIEFSKGLNILSGETGAGKSIIIDSLNFVLGARSDKTLIRHGEADASVDAEFDGVNDRVQALLDEFDIDASEGLIISRKMTLDGKNTCRINGVKLTVSVLKQIAGALVDIYGQHENSILLNSDTHLGIIDSFGAEELKPLIVIYQQIYNEYKKINSDIKKYGSIKDVNKTISNLEREISEIKFAKITIGEEDELNKLASKIENSEEILTALKNSTSLLNGEEEYNALSNIAVSIKELSKITSFDTDIEECVNRLNTIKIDLQDIARTLSHMADSIDFDEFESKKTMDRLDLIRDLESKYGDTEQEILNYYEKILKEYEFYSNAEFELIKLNKLKETVGDKLYYKALELTKKREEISVNFSKSVENELKLLGMPQTVFKVNLKSDYTKEQFFEMFNGIGGDVAEFMISPNIGQPLKPLAKIISGGEMSRLMLAIKKISAQIDGVNVMVFDEVDTGISGHIAGVVATKLYDISCDRQVLAVTHLPQLASMADNHYLITKTSDLNSTHTNITLLNYDLTIKEIARLTGGAEESEFALPHAKKMKENSDLYKKSIN